jgi:hypothetical protein
VTVGSDPSMVARAVLTRLDAQLAHAHDAIASDAGASPVLAAVVDEFARKLTKTRAKIEAEGGSSASSREALVELEQAGDSAKWAATADLGATEATRHAVIDAHDTICHFKSTGELLDPGGN